VSESRLAKGLRQEKRVLAQVGNRKYRIPTPKDKPSNERPRGLPRGIEERNTYELRSKLRGIPHPARAG
jgi:hypothetical protein